MNEHPLASAISIATTAVPNTTPGTPVAQVINETKSFSSEYETIDYIYVLKNRQLVGVVSLHELFSASPTKKVDEVMTTDIAYVHAQSDQEKVATVALAQNIKAVPVLDTENQFVGVVTSDTILQVLRDEQTEDILKFAGVSFTASERLSQFTIIEHLKSRLPWLLLGLAGGVLAAVVVERFTDILQDTLILAAFIPAIVYIADAVGSQTQMVYVRSLMSSRRTTLSRTLQRELTVATAVGITLATTAGGIVYTWLNNDAVTIVVSVSILITVYFSVIVAILLPWTFERLKLDPALATGPLATVIRDISSLCIYFLFALFWL